MPTESIPDIHVEIRVRNNQLLARRKELGLSQQLMAKAVGIPIGSYGALECCKLSPLTSKGAPCSAAVALSNFWDTSVEELFPDVIRQLGRNRIERQISAEQFMALATSQVSTEDQLDNARNEKLLSGRVELVLDTLTEREEFVVAMRFGLGDEQRAHTLQEVGDELEISSSRAGQIEARALRKLRHPSRSKHLMRFVGADGPNDRTLRDEGIRVALLMSEWIHGCLRGTVSIGAKNHGRHLHYLSCNHSRQLKLPTSHVWCPSCRRIIPRLLLQYGVPLPIVEVLKAGGDPRNSYDPTPSSTVTSPLFFSHIVDFLGIARPNRAKLSCNHIVKVNKGYRGGRVCCRQCAILYTETDRTAARLKIIIAAGEDI